MPDSTIGAERRGARGLTAIPYQPTGAVFE